MKPDNWWDRETKWEKFQVGLLIVWHWVLPALVVLLFLGWLVLWGLSGMKP